MLTKNTSIAKGVLSGRTDLPWRWIDDLRFEVVSDDPEPEYFDSDNVP